MEIQLAPERVFALQERFGVEEIKQRAMDRRVAAFGSGLGSILQRPKADDIGLVQFQRRLEPFWHVACRARYAYERERDYVVPVSAPEVQEVTLEGSTQPVNAARTFSIRVREHCREESARESFADGVTGLPVTDAQMAIQGSSAEVEDLSTLSTDDTVVVPPEHRASYVIRELFSQVMKPLQADTVSEESLTLERTDLYYRPVWAFEFEWKPRQRRGVVELDGITGQTRQAAALVPQLRRMVSKDVLFDIGADTAGLLIPGGSIAVKVARAAVDRSYGRS